MFFLNVCHESRRMTPIRSSILILTERFPLNQSLRVRKLCWLHSRGNKRVWLLSLFIAVACLWGERVATRSHTGFHSGHKGLRSSAGTGAAADWWIALWKWYTSSVASVVLIRSGCWQIGFFSAALRFCSRESNTAVLQLLQTTGEPGWTWQLFLTISSIHLPETADVFSITFVSRVTCWFPVEVLYIWDFNSSACLHGCVSAGCSVCEEGDP